MRRSHIPPDKRRPRKSITLSPSSSVASFSSIYSTTTTSGRGLRMPGQWDESKKTRKVSATQATFSPDQLTAIYKKVQFPVRMLTEAWTEVNEPIATLYARDTNPYTGKQDEPRQVAEDFVGWGSPYPGFQHDAEQVTEQAHKLNRQMAGEINYFYSDVMAGKEISPDTIFTHFQKYGASALSHKQSRLMSEAFSEINAPIRRNRQLQEQQYAQHERRLQQQYAQREQRLQQQLLANEQRLRTHLSRQKQELKAFSEAQQAVVKAQADLQTQTFKAQQKMLDVQRKTLGIQAEKQRKALETHTQAIFENTAAQKEVKNNISKLLLQNRVNALQSKLRTRKKTDAPIGVPSFDFFANFLRRKDEL